MFYMIRIFQGVIEKQMEVKMDLKQIINKTNDLRLESLLNPNKLLSGKSLTYEDMIVIYPDMDQVEKNEHDLLSFFTKTHDHIVMKQKELLVERQHGHLMIHGDINHVSENVMATTNWMFGVF